MSSTGFLSEDERYAAALAASGVSPARLRRLLQGRPPRQAWEALRTGADLAGAPQPRRDLLSDDVVDAVARRCVAEGVDIHLRGTGRYPRCLAEDPEAPAVLFSRGDPTVLDGRARVAVVGTRSASATGLRCAQDLGRDLAGAGVVVVSGLALGIDSAVHSGAVSVSPAAPAVAVLGTAHDGRATPEQRSLAADLERAGATLAELPPGTEGARWRFAVRNRVMAALAQLVVVVECHRSGGALYTVRAARRRTRRVAAVPGSVRSPASDGTNRLLVEGAACVRNAADVLELLGSARLAVPAGAAVRDPRSPTPARAADLGPCAREVLGVLEDLPISLEAVVLRAGHPLAQVASALEELAALGLADSHGGWWAATGPKRAG